MTALGILEKALVGQRVRFMSAFSGELVVGVCVGIHRDDAIEEGTWLVYQIALPDGTVEDFPDHDADLDFEILGPVAQAV